jgi:two-component system sensor histidine kinase/response regulator
MTFDPEERAAELFRDGEERLHAATDRLFVRILLLQWAGAIAAAIWLSPRTWAGATSSPHVHLFAALLLGAALIAMPLWLVAASPGRAVNRHVIGVAQMLFSALLIHLTGGRIETHFHVFGSLAFIAFYRDWRVLLSATVITALDHLLRGSFFPQSVFGVIAPAPWRWLEHAAWVLFLDAFLLISMRRSVAEMREVAFRQAQLEATNARIESVVEERTRELAATRDEALAASRQKAEFLANMSHEIRTPMNGVLGFVNLLGATRLDAEQRQHVDTIAESGEALLTILNDVLDLSKIEAGKIEIEAIDFDLANLCSGVARILTPVATAKGIGFVCRTAAIEGLIARGDPTRIRQVLLNVCGNGVKFTGSGEVTLDVGVEREVGERLHLAFTVRDTGIGIPKDRVDELFRPFHQVDGSITRRFGGTGLGLAISRRLVEMLGGTIELVSEPGIGTCFTIRIPLLRGAALTSARRIEENPDARAGGMTTLDVLLAEDNSVNRRLVCALLERRGHRVSCVVNGEEAVETAGRRAFDLVLMDAQMPLVDGLEATRRIRAAEIESGAQRRVRIVALTAHAMKGYREQCFEAGMDDYLTKPIEIAELERVLRECAVSESRIPTS